MRWPPDDQWGDISEVPTTAAIAAGVESEDEQLQDAARLRSLAQSGLGAQLDPKMQAVAERAQRWLGVPIALVSLVGRDRQVFPGMTGLPEPWATSVTLRALALPARRDRDRAADRVGPPRASPAPGRCRPSTSWARWPTPGCRSATRRATSWGRCARSTWAEALDRPPSWTSCAAWPRRVPPSCGCGCPGSRPADERRRRDELEQRMRGSSTAARRCTPRPRRSATPSPSRTCAVASASW